MKTKVLILGAGISGLSTASQLRKDDYLIIERENVAGGYCKSFYEDGFVWDYAGHFFHFSKKENDLFFRNVFKDDCLLEWEKNTKIIYKNKYIDYPFQCNIHQLEKNEFIDCLYDLFFRDKSNYLPVTFKEMLIAKFGKSISNKFLCPYNEKLYACDLNKLDKDAMGRFFPYASLEDIIRNFKCKDFNTYNNKFIYPVRGAQSIVDFLYNRLDKEKIIFNTNVLKIDTEGKKILTDKGSIEYKYLISTIPFVDFLKYSDKWVSRFEDILTYNKVLVFNLGFDSNNEQLKQHWVYIPEKKYNFYRVGFYNNILNTDRMSLYIEIGFQHDTKIDIEQQLNQTLINLRKLGIVTTQKMTNYKSLIMDPAYVHISGQSEKIKHAFFEKMEYQNVYFVGRYGAWTYCSMEDCIEQSKAVVKYIKHD